MFDPSTVRVLVLDDDQVMREVLEALLSLEGYQVQLASSGEEALGMLADQADFDVILTDLQMPNLEGPALVSALRGAAKPENLLIGMSGSDPSDGLLALLDGFLAKPFDPQSLQPAIEQARTQRDDSQTGSNVTTETQPSATAALDQPGEHVPLDETIFQALARLIPPGQLGQLYEMTLGDIQKRLGRMESSAAEGDLPAVRREAHAIKGSCGMVGATELQALAAAVEDGTTLNTSALTEIPAACLRLQRMLSGKLQTV